MAMIAPVLLMAGGQFFFNLMIKHPRVVIPATGGISSSQGGRMQKFRATSG